jgi:type II secretory pathway pseudopilin PulG
MLNKSNHSKGFTLVETAIVVLIGGLLLTMLFDGMSTYLKNTRLSVTKTRIAEIDNQIQIYLEDRGYLPCPARLAAPIDTTSTSDPYGVETDCSAAAIPGNTFTSGTVRIGMVPTRTLNLPDDYGYDAWGNRILYAVTTNQARTAGLYSRTGGTITVMDAGQPTANVITSTAHYVIASHGRDGAGGYNYNGILGTNCPAANATLDQENCDNDEIFRNTMLVSDSGTNRNFDDIVRQNSASNFNRSMPPEAVMLFRLPACPDGWIPSSVPAGPPANHIYCRKN